MKRRTVRKVTTVMCKKFVRARNLLEKSYFGKKYLHNYVGKVIF